MDTKMITSLFLFILLLSVAWVVLTIKSLLKTLILRKRLVSLRMNPEQVPFASEQPLPLFILKGKQTPPVLTKRLSGGVHLIMLAVWFGISVLLTLGIFFPGEASVSDTLVRLGEALGIWSAYWVALQGIITLVFYQHIEANESGLLVQRGVLHRRISWDQAHLFAIDATNFSRTTLNQFELSSTQQMLRWENSTRSLPQFVLKPTFPEYQRELERLTSYIHEKTGLPLRDLRFFREEPFAMY